MPDLILRLIGEGYKIVSFPVREYWLDIGRIEDYQQAIADTGYEASETVS
jgi:NDP-sugar pyrophosphorylase family protein